MCAQPLEAFSSFLRTFPVVAGKSLPAAFCALQGRGKTDLRREKSLPPAQKRQRTGFHEGGAVPCQAPLPSETRQNNAFRHQKRRNPPPCAHGLLRPFLLFSVHSPSLREKASLRSFAPCMGVEKLIFGKKKACLRHKTARRRLARRRSRTVSGSLCQPSGRTAERPHGGRKNGKGGAQAFLQRCGQKKTPASRERPALSDRKKG